MVCDWCGKEKDDLERIEEWGKAYSVCGKCGKLKSEDKCVTCKRGLYGEMSIRGECGGCQQVTLSSEEKRRSEVMNGLVELEYEEPIGMKNLSEDDFERWMVSGSTQYKPEQRIAARKIWIKFRLVNSFGWTEEEVNEHIEDIHYIQTNYSVKLAKKDYLFVLDGKSGTKNYGMLLEAVKGKVRLYRAV